MSYLKQILKQIILKPSLYFFVFLLIITIDRHHRYEHGKENVGTFYSDVYEYYRFLPDIFIRGTEISKTDIQQNKRTIGMSILYSPFFFMGHAIAHYNGNITDGYSLPYQQCLRWGSIMFCFLGLWYSRKSLLLFFNETTVLITLICVLFGTNLFYYTYGWGELPHVYLFALNSIFIYSTLNWILYKRYRYLLLTALMAGLITLIRPTGIIVLLFPILFSVSSFSDVKNRLKFIFDKPFLLIAAFTLFMFPLILQMLFWKLHVGQYIYYSYGKEGFFFNDPQIQNFLFSYRKGWLLYTPIMAFALIGMGLSKKYLNSFYIFNIAFFVLLIYVLSSWWEWSYGGSFGCRVLIEYYSFFIFPFAAFVKSVWKMERFRFIYRVLILVVFYLFIELNFTQTKQVRLGIMHWSGMSKDAYWEMFLKTNLSKEEILRIQSKCIMPNAEKMIRGERDL